MVAFAGRRCGGTTLLTSLLEPADRGGDDDGWGGNLAHGRLGEIVYAVQAHQNTLTFSCVGACKLVCHSAEVCHRLLID